jgi:hypothetical protein
MGKITPGLRWIVNGILINCWRTLFQVLVNFYENGEAQPSVSCLIKHDNDLTSVLNSLKYDYKRLLIRMNNYIIILIRMNNYIKNTNEDEFYQI